MPSRFLRELPAERIGASERLRGVDGDVSRDADPSRPLRRSGAVARWTGRDYGSGSGVRHPKFGEGVVLTYEGQGSHARVQVNFKTAGSKWLVVTYANLLPL